MEMSRMGGVFIAYSLLVLGEEVGGNMTRFTFDIESYFEHRKV